MMIDRFDVKLARFTACNWDNFEYRLTREAKLCQFYCFIRLFYCCKKLRGCFCIACAWIMYAWMQK